MIEAEGRQQEHRIPTQSFHTSSQKSVLTAAAWTILTMSDSSGYHRIPVSC